MSDYSGGDLSPDVLHDLQLLATDERIPIDIRLYCVIVLVQLYSDRGSNLSPKDILLFYLNRTTDSRLNFFLCCAGDLPVDETWVILELLRILSGPFTFSHDCALSSLMKYRAGDILNCLNNVDSESGVFGMYRGVESGVVEITKRDFVGYNTDGRMKMVVASLFGARYLEVIREAMSEASLLCKRDACWAFGRIGGEGHSLLIEMVRRRIPDVDSTAKMVLKRFVGRALALDREPDVE